ncbi:hypothetical protein B5E60_06485 [Alistipes sp. An116]|nr:hypothetical protein B5E60_06485 [Alistipes sp. An116]
MPLRNSAVRTGAPFGRIPGIRAGRRPDLSRPDLPRPDLPRPDLSRPDLSRPDQPSSRPAYGLPTPPCTAQSLFFCRNIALNDTGFAIFSYLYNK